MVPKPGDPQSLNRYAYARNNPLRYNDPTGHCWGAFSFIRQLPGYSTTCNNLDMAVTILKSDQASPSQKVAAGAYVAAESGAHLMLAAGAAMLAGEGAAALLSGTSAAGAGATAEAAATAACADGDCTNEVTAAEQTGLEVFERAQEFGIRPYNELRKLTQGTGLQVHHIVERRFADVGTLEIAPKRMLSVVLTPEEHQVFTNMWRKAIGYSNSLNPIKTTTATAEDIWDAAQSIYAKIPALLDAARRTIFGE